MALLAENNVMRYCSLIFTIIGIALTATSLFTDHWVDVEVINPKGHNLIFHRGLMQWVCINQKDISDRSCIAKFLKRGRMYLSVVCTALSFTSFLLITIAIGIFGGQSRPVYFETFVYKGLTVICHLGWSYWLSVMVIIISILCTSLETVQIFLNSNMGYTSSTLPPEAMATWKYTM
uniref:Claudin-like protein n=2 Tax=Caenorhabditis tropicalis TaxID=1561998 RepID=A0A1I7TJ05_9PELO